MILPTIIKYPCIRREDTISAVVNIYTLTIPPWFYCPIRCTMWEVGDCHRWRFHHWYLPQMTFYGSRVILKEDECMQSSRGILFAIVQYAVVDDPAFVLCCWLSWFERLRYQPCVGLYYFLLFYYVWSVHVYHHCQHQHLYGTLLLELRRFLQYRCSISYTALHSMAL